MQIAKFTSASGGAFRAKSNADHHLSSPVMVWRTVSRSIPTDEPTGFAPNAFSTTAVSILGAFGDTSTIRCPVAPATIRTGFVRI
jgi:hypothetical protein